MSAVPVTINCMIYPRDKSGDPYPATLVGIAWAPGLKPEHPIELPPGVKPPVEPPDIWGGANEPFPTPPIVIPPPEVDPPPVDLPDPPTMVKPPPPDGGWAYSPEWGWGYYPGSGGAGPKKR